MYDKKIAKELIQIAKSLTASAQNSQNTIDRWREKNPIDSRTKKIDIDDFIRIMDKKLSSMKYFYNHMVFGCIEAMIMNYNYYCTDCGDDVEFLFECYQDYFNENDGR